MGSQATALSVVDLLSKASGYAVKYGPVALPLIEIAAGFIPGGAPVVKAVELALPYLSTVAKYAPLATEIVKAGTPVFDFIDKHSADLIPAFRNILAIGMSYDQGRDVDPAEVSDEMVYAFATHPLIGKPWTPEETKAFFDRFSLDLNR